MLKFTALSDCWPNPAVVWGPKRTWSRYFLISAIEGKADLPTLLIDVRFTLDSVAELLLAWVLKLW